MSDASGHGVPATDPVVQAIDQLADAIEENARDERRLARRLRRLRAGRAAGRSWRRLLDSEPDPGTLMVVGRVLARMSGASGVLRRALAQAVRGEGETVAEIARRFGVSHQRVSTILRGADGPAAEASRSSDLGSASTGSVPTRVGAGGRGLTRVAPPATRR